MTAWIDTPAGEPGSGRVRYGAAMALHRQGLLSDTELEEYRVAAAHDGLDLKAGDRAPLPPAAALRHLVAEADRYLATLAGPGIAESRAGIARWQAGPVTPATGDHPVVTAHLPAALTALAATHPGLSAAINAATPHLNWINYDSYPTDLIGDFRHSHAYACIIGERATIPAVDFDLGLFLIAPHVLYPDHSHAAPELYAPLTGPHGWRFHPGAPLTLKPAHLPVWNDPHSPHLTKVGAIPFLCLFCWTRDVNIPAVLLSSPDWPALAVLRL